MHRARAPFGVDGLRQGQDRAAHPDVLWTDTLDEILARAAHVGHAPFVLVLEHLQDPTNFGTLLRSAEAAGVDGVVFPERGAAPDATSAASPSITPAALVAASLTQSACSRIESGLAASAEART